MVQIDGKGTGVYSGHEAIASTGSSRQDGAREVRQRIASGSQRVQRRPAKKRSPREAGQGTEKDEKAVALSPVTAALFCQVYYYPKW